MSLRTQSVGLSMLLCPRTKDQKKCLPGINHVSCLLTASIITVSMIMRVTHPLSRSYHDASHTQMILQKRGDGGEFQMRTKCVNMNR